jgi:ketosteroid isomerase-like protein
MGAQEDQNIAVIKKVYEYVDKGDRDGWMHLIADDCEFHEPPSLPYGGAYIGKIAMLRGLKNMRGTWDNMEYHIHNFFASGDSVVIHLTIGATGRKTGKHFWLPIMELWRVRDGLIRELRPFIFDTARMVEVYG